MSGLADELKAVVLDALDQRLRPLEERVEKAPAEAPDDDRALTVQEAAEFARYSLETIMERIRAKDLPAHKPKGSREWRVRLGDLKRWLWFSSRDGVLLPLDKDTRARKILGLASETDR